MAIFTSHGKPIRVDEYEPSAPGRHPAIVLLHGSGGNVSFWAERVAPYLLNMNVGLYAIHYFDRTGTGRATAATILDGLHYPQWLSTVCDGLAYVRARPSVAKNRVAVLGISLGAFLALSAGVSGANKIRALVEISGGLPEMYVSQVTESYPPTLIVHGDADTVVPVSQAKALERVLARAAVPYQTEILAGQGHWFDSAAQIRIVLAMSGFLRKYL